MKRAIQKHSGDVVAIVALLVLSVAVSGYVLSNERLRFPFIESSPFTLKAAFQTAQAVTPGQGQSVRVSGVQIGDIGGVTLQNGLAVVSMDIDQK
jgi:phospholipid/cholesterol/gamma-HCH transport system substrate-binding protein